MSTSNLTNVEPYRTVKANSREFHELKCLNPTRICFIFGILIVLIAILINNIDLKSMSEVSKGDQSHNKLIYAVYGKDIDSGFLKHVFEVLEKFGYTRGTLEDDWNLLWAHDYPFKKLFNSMKNLKSHQKVNHFPGSGYITNKVELASSKMLTHVPIAFKIPTEKEKFLEYTQMNPEKQFVQKSNSHRGIKILSVNELDLENGQTFIQEYINNPFLIDGYKFDIGIYTIVTSIDPLRLYIYDGDVLLRFCTQKYYPFDPSNIDKYVIGDDYLPTWELPSLKKYYVDLGFSMKESLNAYLRSKGKDPLKLWKEVEEAIRNIYLEKETSLIQTTSLNYQSKNNFFEMVRIDLIIDEDLNVYIMEANMSPNLSSAHFAPNRLLYQQVLFNLFGLIGVGRSSTWNRNQEENDMEVAIKDIVVSPKQCSTKNCRSCISPQCHLCRYCWTSDTRKELQIAFLEHINRGLCKRIFPPTMLNESDTNKTIVWENYSPENQLIYRWFQEKCLMDPKWCT